MVAINPPEQTTQTTKRNTVHFRWIYVILPLFFLAISIILLAVFYARLTPAIAYHFHGATPDRWLSRSAFLGWMIIPQVFLTLLSLMFVRLMLAGASYWPPESTPLQLLLPVMGNMLALPQIILFIAMLQFMLYNAYQTTPFPLWIIALIVLAAGAAALGVFFAYIIRQARRRQGKNQQE